MSMTLPTYSNFSKANSAPQQQRQGGVILVSHFVPEGLQKN